MYTFKSQYLRHQIAGRHKKLILFLKAHWCRIITKSHQKPRQISTLRIDSSPSPAMKYISLILLLILSVGFGFYLTQDTSTRQLTTQAITDTVSEAPLQEAPNDTNTPRPRPSQSAETSPSPATSQKSISELTQKLSQNLQKNQTTAAQETIADIRAQDPQNVTALRALGELAARNENPTQLRSLDQAASQPSLGQEFRVRAHLAEQNYEAASDLLSQIPDKTPELQWYTGILQSLQNRHQLAQSTLESLRDQAFALDDGTVSDALYSKVKATLEAYDVWDQYTEAADPHLFTLIGQALTENYEASLGWKFADTALREDVRYTDAWIVRGYSAYLLGRFDEAVEDLKYAYKLDTVRPETQYFLALALEANDQAPEATLYYEKAVAFNFGFDEAVQWKLVNLYRQTQQYEKMLTLYEQLLQSDTPSAPDDFVPGLQAIIDEMRDVKKARELSEKILERHPDNLTAQNLHGWALIADGKYRQAENILEAALEANLTFPRTYVHLGLLSEKRGDLTEAKSWYRQGYDLAQQQKDEAVANLAARQYNGLITTDTQS